MKRPLFSALAAAALAAGALLASAVPASAADGDLSWAVQPSSSTGSDPRTDLSYQVAPGTVVSDGVAVTNHSPVAATFRVYAADATTNYDTGAFTLLSAGQASIDAGAWTSLDGAPAVCTDTNDEAEGACTTTLGTSVTLEPGARADVPFTLTVPHDARPGDHAAGIVASLVSDSAGEGGAAVAVEQRVGVRIYLRVDGPLTPGLSVQGTVAGYTPSLNPFSGGTTEVGFDVRNTGNTRLSVQPTVRLNGPFGIPLGAFDAEPVQNLVAGGVTHVRAELSGIPPLLLLFADVTAAPVPAAGVAEGDPLPAAATAAATAWAVPWMLLAAAIVIVAVVLLLLWRRRSVRARLADELAAYTDRVRAETLQQASELHPVPVGARRSTFTESETPR